MIVRRVGPLALAKISGLLYGIMGLIFGAIFSLVSMTAAAFGGKDAGPFGVLFGVGAIIALPIFYGLLGFLAGLIGAGLYNLIAGWMGGVELEVQ